jgi:hypothetical protein
MIKTGKIFTYLLGFSFMIFGLFALVGFYQESTAARAKQAMDKGAQVPALAALQTDQPLSYYIAIADEAVKAPATLPVARAATMHILSKDPSDVSSWNRLAFIDVAENGRLTRDGLAALYQSYHVSPYGDLQVMTWRVDFASNIWSSLPMDLKQKTIGQIEVIGKFGISWDWRIENCRYNPVPAIYEAACAIAPGTVRPQTG